MSSSLLWTLNHCWPILALDDGDLAKKLYADFKASKWGRKIVEIAQGFFMGKLDKEGPMQGIHKKYGELIDIIRQADGTQ